MGGAGLECGGSFPLSLYIKKTRAKISLDSRLTNNLKGRKAALIAQSDEVASSYLLQADQPFRILGHGVIECVACIDFPLEVVGVFVAEADGCFVGLILGRELFLEFGRNVHGFEKGESLLDEVLVDLGAVEFREIDEEVPAFAFLDFDGFLRHHVDGLLGFVGLVLTDIFYLGVPAHICAGGLYCKASRAHLRHARAGLVPKGSLSLTQFISCSIVAVDSNYPRAPAFPCFQFQLFGTLRSTF